eukprot:XP_023973486.1 uncharacterized protein LOC112062758 [Physeter catodon]
MSEHVRGITGKHRNPTELQAALKVINEQLADANDLERPALELVAQKLTEQLLEVELEEESKHERQCAEEAKRPPCRESERLERPQHSPAPSATPASDVPAAQEPTQTAQKQRTEGGPDKASERDDEWKAFLKALPRVLIADGTQKYVLIRISPEQNPNKHLESSIYLVRGDPAVEYHYQCALDTMKELETMGAEGEILGGGRIECRMKEKEVEIYGHSYQFGRADHAVTAQLIKDAFGSDFQVSWGDYGY